MNGDYQEAYEPGDFCGYSCPVIFQSRALYGFPAEKQGLFRVGVPIFLGLRLCYVGTVISSTSVPFLARPKKGWPNPCDSGFRAPPGKVKSREVVIAMSRWLILKELLRRAPAKILYGMFGHPQYISETRPSGSDSPKCFTLRLGRLAKFSHGEHLPQTLHREP